MRLFQRRGKIAETAPKLRLLAEMLFNDCRFVCPELVYCHFLSMCAAEVNTHFFFFFSSQRFQIGFHQFLNVSISRIG